MTRAVKCVTSRVDPWDYTFWNKFRLAARLSTNQKQVYIDVVVLQSQPSSEMNLHDHDDMRDACFIFAQFRLKLSADICIGIFYPAIVYISR